MSGNLDQIGAILTHTPAWVFVLFAVLVALGAQAMRPRVVAPQRLLVTPLVFIVWGLVSLVSKPHFSSLLASEWVVVAALGMALGWSTTRLTGLKVDRASRRAHLPGSPALLVRIVTVFCVKYALNATAAIHPDMADRLAPWDVAVSGLMAGYFLGWLLRFWSRYRNASALDGASPALMGVAE